MCPIRRRRGFDADADGNEILSDIRKILPQGFFSPPCPLRGEPSLVFPFPDYVNDASGSDDSDHSDLTDFTTVRRP
ncbi:hypothetical protein EVAR_30738_1 [Eumeta japonica]|uniref:Uncharacterized protein n=1 Tax=Eumeta variegata TaxID=151549 RepID=A0A4C1V8X1_EUMVA|nr:hypothetical protein EVAR_30738_1 [Eumeta japonica]